MQHLVEVPPVKWCYKVDVRDSNHFSMTFFDFHSISWRYPLLSSILYLVNRT